MTVILVLFLLRMVFDVILAMKEGDKAQIKTLESILEQLKGIATNTTPVP